MKKYMELMKRERSLFWGILLWALFLWVVTYKVLPLNDDLYYVIAPNKNFSLEQLRPTATFWRPFDVLIGGVNGLYPALYPYLCRILVIVGHCLCGVYLYRVLRQIHIEILWARLILVFFLGSSGAVAVWVSPDAINQVYSLLIGEIALYNYMHTQKYRYYCLVFVALLFKESGISWLAVIPLMKLYYEILVQKKQFNQKYFKNICKDGVTVISIAILYFSCRFLLMGKMELGASDGVYSLSFVSASTIKNYINMLGAASTGIDTVALFLRKNTLILFLTGICSIIFLLSLFWVCVKKKNNGLKGYIIFALIILALGLPQAMIQSAGEMHAYPVLFGVSLLIAYIIKDVKANTLAWKIILGAFGCIFFSFVMSTTDKIITINDYSNRVKEFTIKLNMIYGDENSILLLSDAMDEEGYSIYWQSELAGSDYGHSIVQYHNWNPIEIIYNHVNSKEEAMQYARQMKNEFGKIIFYHNKNFEVLEQ